MKGNTPCLYGRETGKGLMISIAFMDDASRFITCYGVFDSATTENTINVLREGFAEYGIPDGILTDHGTQFVAAKGREKAKHKFKEFLKENGVRHILARINRPQTNGKIERFFGLMEQKLHLFDSVEEFIYWYCLLKGFLSIVGGGCLRSEIISGYHSLKQKSKNIYNRVK